VLTGEVDAAMFNMMYKEFIVERVALLSYAALTAVFTRQRIAENATLAFISLLAMSFALSTVAHDDRSNAHMFITSLPVSRREIVTAKYLFHIAAGFGLIGLAVIVKAIDGGLEFSVAWGPTALALLLVVWFLSIFFPLYYWLGPRFAKIGLIALFISMFAIFPMVYHLGLKRSFWGIPDLILSLPAFPLYASVAAGTLALLLASWRISVWLYSRKEL